MPGAVGLMGNDSVARVIPGARDAERMQCRTFADDAIVVQVGESVQETSSRYTARFRSSRLSRIKNWLARGFDFNRAKGPLCCEEQTTTERTMEEL